MSKESWSNISVAACLISMAGIIVSPSIPVTLGILVVGASIALFGLGKIQSK